MEFSSFDCCIHIETLLFLQKINDQGEETVSRRTLCAFGAGGLVLLRDSWV